MKDILTSFLFLFVILISHCLSILYCSKVSIRILHLLGFWPPLRGGRNPSRCRITDVEVRGFAIGKG